jgi:uncharacterized Rmd1/YagE family protein
MAAPKQPPLDADQGASPSQRAILTGADGTARNGSTGGSEMDDAQPRPSPQDAASAGALIGRAHLLGERLDLRGLEQEQKLAMAPLMTRVGDAGYAVFLRYGIVVAFNLGEAEEQSLLASLRHRVSDAYDPPEAESLQITARADSDDQIDPSGRIVIKEITAPRLQIIADILAKHLILLHYEAGIAQVFDRLEPLAGTLWRTGRSGSQTRLLLQQIGGVLLIQHKMVGRVEVTEHPEVLWENPGLERFYARLESEYELRERSRALDRKLEFIFRTAETLLRLVESRRTLRLEWYVVALILLEILLSLYSIVVSV